MRNSVDVEGTSNASGVDVCVVLESYGAAVVVVCRLVRV